MIFDKTHATLQVLQGLRLRLDLVLQHLVLFLDGFVILLVRLNLLLQLPVFRVDGLKRYTLKI